MPSEKPRCGTCAKFRACWEPGISIEPGPALEAEMKLREEVRAGACYVEGKDAR